MRQSRSFIRHSATVADWQLMYASVPRLSRGSIGHVVSARMLRIMLVERGEPFGWALPRVGIAGRYPVMEVKKYLVIFASFGERVSRISW